MGNLSIREFIEWRGSLSDAARQIAYEVAGEVLWGDTIASAELATTIRWTIRSRVEERMTREGVE
jgi:hypothetical protein